MNSTFMGRTGVRVSQLCFGTMSFGNEADEAASATLFHRAREAGINTFDTADVYSQGRSEEILGGLIRDCRDEIVLASKVYFPTSGDGNARGLSRYHIVRAVEDSLRRLGTDYIDLYYMHRHDDVTDLEETWRAVDDLVSAGKILYPAISNYSAWQGMKSLERCRARGWALPVCVQPMYNLAKRQAEVEILPMAQSEEMAVMPYSPTAGGLLTGKYGVDKRPEKGRLVDVAMYSVRYGEDDYYELADRFCAIAAEQGVHPAALAIAWAGAHPGVTAPIIGARNLEQLETAIASTKIQMSFGDELYERIRQVSADPAPATDRNEERSAHNFGSR